MRTRQVVKVELNKAIKYRQNCASHEVLIMDSKIISLQKELISLPEETEPTISDSQFNKILNYLKLGKNK